MYFKAALELGLGGLIVFLVILGSLAIAGWRARRDAPDIAAIGVGIGAIVVVSGVTGPMLDAYPMNVLFWSTAGWILWASSRRRLSDPAV
jgi:hypothetical protein